MIRPLPEIREAEEMIKANKLRRSLPLYKRCLDIVAAIPDPCYRGVVLFKMAKAYQSLANFASEGLHLALLRGCLVEKSGAALSFLPLLDCSIAVAQVRAGDASVAVDTCSQAIVEAERAQEEGHEEGQMNGLVKLHILSGMLSYLQGTARCLQAWQRAEQLAGSMPTQQNSHMLGILNVLRGDFHKFNAVKVENGKKMEEEAEALGCYIAAETHFKEAQCKDGVIVALRKLGGLQGKNGEEALKVALATAKEQHDNKHPIVGECLYALAYYYFRTGEAVHSEGLYRSSISLLEHSSTHPDYTSSSVKMLLGEALMSYAELLQAMEFNGRPRSAEALLARQQCQDTKVSPQVSSVPSLEVWLIHELSST